MTASLALRPHYLYRHYAACGCLLYVGCTVDPSTRPVQRQGRGSWIDESARVVVSEAYPDWETARRAEDQAIHDERPLHNRAYNRTGRWGYYSPPLVHPCMAEAVAS